MEKDRTLSECSSDGKVTPGPIDRASRGGLLRGPGVQGSRWLKQGCWPQREGYRQVAS